MIIVTQAILEPNKVETDGTFLLKVKIKETVDEPMSYRLPFTLGSEKGILSTTNRIGGI